MEKLTKKIVLVETEERGRNWIWSGDPGLKKFREFGTENFQILPIDKALDCSQLKESLKGSSPEEGMVFIQHPYKEDVYVKAEDFQQRMDKDKNEALRRIASLLGVKKVKVKAINYVEEKRNCDANLKLKVEEVKIDVKTKEEREEKLTNLIESEYEYEGRGTNVGKAWEIAEEYGLKNDDEVKALIESRSPNHPNKLTKMNCTIETTKECNERFDLAIRLKVVGAFNVAGSFKEVVSKKEKYFFIYTMEF
jgi:hypothetical protein